MRKLSLYEGHASRRTARDGSEEAVGERREEERATEHHEGRLVAAVL